MTKCLLIALSGVMSLFWSTDAIGLREWVVGNEMTPWERGRPTLNAIDTRTLRGWIRLDSISTEVNLSLGAVGQGGGISSPQGIMTLQELKQYEGSKGLNLMKNMIDGDTETIFEMDEESARGTVTGFMVLDLGGIIPGVNRIRFYPRGTFKERFLRGYEVAINDGSPKSVEAGGILVWQMVARKDRNSDPVVEITIPPQPVRYVKLQSRTTLRWEVAELEVYGGGFVPQASYTSEVIDVGGKEGSIANFGRLFWSARIDPEARMEIRTRSGRTPDPFRYYQLVVEQRDTVEVALPDPLQPGTAREQYEKLKEGERRQRFDTENWSFWSPPYTAVGENIVSPSPRRYFQFQIDLFSDLYTDKVEVDSLTFEYSSPVVARSISAEVSPPVVPAGEIVPFTYTIRPTIQGDDTGFDALEVLTPVKVLSVRDFAVNGTPTPFDSLRAAENGFRLYFPTITGEDTLLTFTFDCRVLVYGTRFETNVFNSRLPDELPQSPDPEVSRLSVNVVLDETLIAGMTALPNPFTPNGDGINDYTVISYQMLKVLEPVPVFLALYDLSYTAVKTYRSDRAYGVYAVVWDGRDDSGTLVPPGIYLYQIRVETETSTDSKTGSVAVVY